MESIYSTQSETQVPPTLSYCMFIEHKKVLISSKMFFKKFTEHFFFKPSNWFEQVSSDGHQMSVAVGDPGLGRGGVGVPCLMSMIARPVGGGSYAVRYNG